MKRWWFAPGDNDLQPLTSLRRSLKAYTAYAVCVFCGTPALVFAVLWMTGYVELGSSAPLAFTVLIAAPLLILMRDNIEWILIPLISAVALFAVHQYGWVYTIGPLYLLVIWLALACGRRCVFIFGGGVCSLIVVTGLASQGLLNVPDLVRWAVYVGFLFLLSEAIARLLDQLAGSIVREQAALQDARQKTEALVSAKDYQQRLFAMVSHELRAPLAKLALIGDSSTAIHRQQRSTALSRLAVVAEELRFLVVPEEALELDLKPVVPRRCIDEVVTQNADLLQRRGVHLTVDCGESLGLPYFLDELKVKTVLSVLIDNVAHHSQASQCDVIADIQGNDLSIRVRDNGIGMDSDLAIRSMSVGLTRSGAQHHGGLGAGFAVVKRIIDAMGGQLMIESPESGGTTVGVTFSLNEDRSFAAPRQKQLEGVALMMLDDDSVFLDLARDEFERQGVAVETFVNPEAAFEFVQSHRLNIILCDHLMPKMAGDEWVARARQHGVGVPIVGLTGSLMQKNNHPMLLAGANDVVEKPLHAHQLVRTIAQFMATLEQQSESTGSVQVTR